MESKEPSPNGRNLEGASNERQVTHNNSILPQCKEGSCHHRKAFVWGYEYEFEMTTYGFLVTGK